MLKYKGYWIIKVFRHGYTYYKVQGFKDIYSYQRDAKMAIDRIIEVGGE